MRITSYRRHFKTFLVVDDGGLAGWISTRGIKELPREAWGRRTVGELAGRPSGDNTVRPDPDAVRALSRMNRTGRSRLMVVDGDRLVGIQALKNLLRFFALKLELEEAFEDLDGPVLRVTWPDVHMAPFSSPLEEYCLPNEERILAALRTLAAY